MTTFVLVHGAWSGAHGFNKVRRELQSLGHEVFTPSLTGIGERSHLASPMIDLTTHVTDLVNTVLFEDLTDIVLLGFSYGGMVVTGSLHHIGDRISQLVYLDAFVPDNGQSAFDLRSADQEPTLSVEQQWYMEPVSRALDDPQDTAWYGPRRSLQPRATFAEAVKLPETLEHWSQQTNTRLQSENIKRLTFIKATTDETETTDSAFWQAARAAEQSDHWNYFEVATNHMVALNRPQELVQLLLNIADS